MLKEKEQTTCMAMVYWIRNQQAYSFYVFRTVGIIFPRLRRKTNKQMLFFTYFDTSLYHTNMKEDNAQR